MSVLQLRQDLHEIIEKADDSVVEAMYAVYRSLKDELPIIVAFTSTGEPLTKESLVERIRSSYIAGKNGETKTAQEVLEEITAW
ncbi:MAG: hypothetical protein H7246_15890 [Phycisphaerae bacterium]|nr:hypothetical protein [Saprospiraceae bacterium]